MPQTLQDHKTELALLQTLLLNSERNEAAIRSQTPDNITANRVFYSALGRRALEEKLRLKAEIEHAEKSIKALSTPTFPPLLKVIKRGRGRF